jgi:hypothetical protein
MLTYRRDMLVGWIQFMLSSTLSVSRQTGCSVTVTDGTQKVPFSQLYIRDHRLVTVHASCGPGPVRGCNCSFPVMMMDPVPAIHPSVTRRWYLIPAAPGTLRTDSVLQERSHMF